MAEIDYVQDKKMGRYEPTNESFYMEDEEMNDNLSMYDLIKLESTLAYYEKQEEAMEGTNTKLTFGYAKMMKDGRKFLQEAKNLLSTKNYKDARDNVFKARKCFVAAYNEINNLPESKISSATGMIMSAIVGTARIINASNELNDFKGYKWAAKLHDVAAVRQLLRQVNVIVGNSSVTNASIYERKRSVAPVDAKFTSNVYKKDILMIIKAYIEVCEVMMRDIGSTHSAAKESAAAIEEYYTDMLHMGAVMEGKNLDVNRRFSDSITAGSKEIEKALMYMRNDRYTEAVEHLDTASDKFETAIRQIHNVDGGILADTIIGGIMRDFVGTYRMFVAASNLKAYGTVGKDWGTKLRIRSVIRILAIGGLPGAGAIDMGLNIGRRFTNTKLEAERGKHKKFTFNGFKEDCINVLNAYMETIEDLKDKVKEAQNNNLSYHQSNILESAIEDEVATEGANLNLNKKFSEIVDKAYKEMKDGAYFLKAGKYEKANAKFKTAKATLENGMDEIDAIDGGILSETILGMLFSGIVGMYQIFDEADNMALLDGVAGFGDGRKTANKLINASIVRYLNALFNVFAGTYLVMLGGMGAAVGWRIVGQMAAELGTVFAVPAAISNIASGASKLIRRDANVKASEKRGKYQKFSLNAFKEDLRYILNGYIEITDNLIERTNTLLEKE